MRGLRGSYIYPAYAHRGGEQAELADWPPVRNSGLEPGSEEMPPEVGPLNGFPTISNMEKTALIVAGGAAAVWWFFIRPKRGRKR